MHFPLIALVASLYGSALAVTSPEGTVSPTYESYQALRRTVAELSLLDRDTEYKNTTSIAKGFDNAMLFEGDIHSGGATVSLGVLCTTCYITADITAELRVSDKFNVSAGIDDIVTNIEADISNITDTIIDSIKTTIKDDADDIVSLNIDEVEWPTIDIDFSLDNLVDDLPSVEFAVTLDNFDVYVDLATTVAAQGTFQFNLFTSEEPYGIKYSDNGLIGVVLTVDLIVTTSSSVTIDHGFHLSIDDGLSFIINLFSSDVNTFVFKGGEFEFLPVTVNSDIELNTVLRVGIHAGVVISTGEVLDLKALDYHAGIEGVIFADVANITTNIAASTNGTAGDDAGVADTCNGDLAVSAHYQFDVGAGVGATFDVGEIAEWGIGAGTQTAVYYTSFVTCPEGTSATAPVPAAVSATATATATVKKRDTFETTLSTSATYSAIGCKSTGLANCPASLQTTTITSTEVFTVLTFDASPTTDVTWPASILTTDIPTKKFGDAASSMLLSVSGAPTLYTPPSLTATGANGEPTPGTPGTTTIFGHTFTDKMRNIIIGVTVGVGVPLVALIVFGCVACFRKRKERTNVAKYDPVVMEETIVYGKK